ncbi:putative Queuine tRNA-ribosyltransferase [Giardia muris]|uniref:Queuine tRNA-ribosyltransferase catalytic subunit 1 n=1 Tax=Giardia muris TaxID=5742 RepID=A0A4Z1TAN7_GIAMU|nr:putative Queuine tRNA-ribosyltransferase [Giardia muris]|eukprot:TNJ30287.1 putative Queuine tRNA-ribosyltransferase [Giardia muris]
MGKGPLVFQVEGTYKRARATTVTLGHGPVQTPVYMPVGTQGTLKGFSTEQIDEMNARIMLSNTYFLNLRPGIACLESMGGLHSLMGRTANLLTDSGGFQMVSLIDLSEVTEEGVSFISPVDSKRLLLTPEESIRTQQAIGSDVMMALDDVVSALLDHERDYERLALSTARTTRWLDRCIATHTSPTQTLFGICQGHLDITPGGFRDQCIRDITERKDRIGGVAIGGLSGGEAKDDFWRVVSYCCEHLPEELPRYVMGVGFPLDLVVCTCLGADMFDCVYSTRVARMGKAMIRSGIISLDKSAFALDMSPLDPDCPCRACRHSKAYLHALLVSKSPVAGQLLSDHNVRYLLGLMSGLRASILNGTLDSYVNDFLRDQFPEKGSVPTWALDALKSAGISLNVV